MAVVTAFVAAVATDVACACGDSLYRVGKGVAYRTYSAPLPGNLLVYSQSDNARQLVADLVQAGHRAVLIASAADLDAELARGGYDIVIAPFAERGLLAPSSLRTASYLPVAMSAAERREAEQAYEHFLEPDNELRHYLKAIHRTLRSRG